MHLHSQIIALSVFHYSAKLVTATEANVCSETGYTVLRPCAKVCLGCDIRSVNLEHGIGCGEHPQIECWCRTDLFNEATSFLSLCVSMSCTIAEWKADFTSAANFYESFCRRAGFTAHANGPANTVATTTISTFSSPSNAVKTEGLTSIRTEPTRAQATNDLTSTLDVPGVTKASIGSGGGKGLSTSDKIALGVGIGLGVPTTFAALVSCYFQIYRRL